MIYYNRIDASEGIDVHKTSEPNECGICHYWYFLNRGFKFQPNVCNKCYDLLMMPMKLCDIAILNIKNADYCCIISKIGNINLMQNANLIII